MKSLVKFCILGVLVIALSGCFSFGGGEEKFEETGEPHLYIIDVDRGQVAEHFVSNRVLLLKPVRVIPQFNTKEMVFKVGENEYQPLAAHQFFAEPSDMFTDQLRRWLQKCGLFSQVIVDDGKPVKADYILESAVTGLYAESRTAYSPQATVEMQFFMSLTGDDSQKVAFQTGLRVDADLEQATPTAAVSGWKDGLFQLLTTLEDDLSGYFSKVDTQ